MKEECTTCHGLNMIASDDPDGDVMNTPCSKCNETDTPETDLEFPVLYENGEEYISSVYARKLERERDEARREAEKYKSALEQISKASGFDNIGKWARNLAKETLTK